MADKQQQQQQASAATPATTNAVPAAAEDSPATMAEYKKCLQRVREMTERRRRTERQLPLTCAQQQIEEAIAQKEAIYLESTPSGNIITGFDNYMKGQSGAAAQRRKTGPLEQNRVFSRSSISYKPNTDGTPGSTPASHAPTPVSGSFSGTATPTTGGGNSKKKKKAAEAEDSEADVPPAKKRVNLGASRK
ncbi:histone acetyltransferase subunit NuA4 [Emericellopsis atlantica]|uniref:Chromatin modification-related protein EAF6 n=1 Tax=Emericellopsis atlantica TaxID=2614577 RepID=A0A9P7ZRK4_9HYPO|nr:histone acetyltransferase subunit NuA4 [Emericellopsis atlantica]KAG9257033.1 histone acetyltransferase subunit NuA4 [Emericellopsis atlantica]